MKVGGRPVGLIEGIELQDDARARIEVSIEDELAPLHEGSVMTLRATSLSGIANKYLALEPGRNDEPEIPDGGEVRAEDGREAVDLDQVLNTLDAQTQRDLQAFVRNSADAFADQPDAKRRGGGDACRGPAGERRPRVAQPGALAGGGDLPRADAATRRPSSASSCARPKSSRT